MLKGYGIVVVTLGHLGVAFLLEKHIYSYHMFLFFLISGYLFVDRPFVETLKKKTTSLLIPFMMWNIISSIVGAIIGYQNLKSFIGTLFILKGDLCFNAPIWFILILFMTEIIYSYLKEKTNISDELLVLISIALFLVIGPLKLPMKVNLIPLAMFSYATGVLLKNSKFLAGGGTSSYIRLVALALISVVFGMFLNSRISYTAGDFGNGIFCIVAAYAGMLFFFFLFKSCFQNCRENVLSFIGKNSFSIMVMQYYFFMLYNKIGEKVFGIGDIWHLTNSLKAILLTSFTVLLILVSVVTYRKVTKGTVLEKLGKLFGI